MPVTNIDKANVRQGKRVREIREEAILAAAIVEFAKNGLKGTTVQAIADRADLQKRQILYFFGSKEQLYEQVIERIFSDWQRPQPTDSNLSPQETFIAYVDNAMEHARAKPDQSKLMIAEMLSGGEHALKILRARRAGKDMDRMVDLIRQCIDDKIMRPVDPFFFIFQIWSAHHFYAAFLPEIKFHLKKKELSAKDWESIKLHVKQCVLGYFIT